MLIEPLLPAERTARLAPVRPTRRRRILQAMLVGSLVLHLLGLLALWLARPESPPDDLVDNSDQVAMVFESPGATEASQQSPTATKASAAPTGNENATTTQPNPDTSPPPPPAQPSPEPPTPAVPEPPAPQPPVLETPPAPETPPPAAPEPTPQPPPVPAPPQPSPTPQQSTVTLSENSGELPPPPPMPQTPPPLPPLSFTVPQRPAPPAPPRLARRSPQSPFGAPQNWSLNTVPSQQPPGRSSRGLDLSTGDFAGQKDATLGYVAGAHPSGDWIGALRRWTTARLYYPEQAIADRQQGTSVLLLTIARSGQVTGVKLVQSARSPFLDGAWIDIFRGSTVPAFTPDMAEDSTQLTYTLHYRLVSHGG